MKKHVWVLIGIALVLGLAQGAWAASVDLELNHTTVEISAFYDGTTIKVTGTVPADADVAIVVSGEPEDLHLKKKGKAGGILWMNMGDLSFENVPRVYMVYTSPGAAEFAESGDLEFSFPALKRRVRIEPEGTDRDFLFGEFLKLKKKEHVYAAYPDSVTLSGASADKREYNADLVIPPRMGQGGYTVTTYAVRDGKVLAQAERNLAVKQTGFPARLTSMAFSHALAYGVVSVLIAVGAGLFTGLIFGGKGGAH